MANLNLNLILRLLKLYRTRNLLIKLIKKDIVIKHQMQLIKQIMLVILISKIKVSKFLNVKKRMIITIHFVQIPILMILTY